MAKFGEHRLAVALRPAFQRGWFASVFAFGLAMFASDCLASTASIVLTQAQIGCTPQYVGYSEGHYLPGSNTSAWLDYSNVNSFRVWLSASDMEPTDDIAPFGDGVTDLTSFNARKAQVRANPTNPTYVNFAQFDDRFKNEVTSGRNNVQPDTILSDLHARGIEPLIEMSRDTSWTMTTWAGKWEQWQHYYAMAYYMGHNYDVSRYQTFNEPDLSSMTQSEWLDRLKISSDAIRSAIADVNRDYGKQLVADISAPVAAGTVNTIDTWGKTALQANRTDYQGNTVNYDIFNTYDVHRYNSTGATFASDMQTFATKIPQYNASGQMMPVVYTEFNRRNSSSFAGSTDTLDTPAMFLGVADDYLGAMSQGVTGMYAFKFSQTLWDDDNNSATPDVPQKTGFHYVNNDYATGGVDDVTGATRGAGVIRLLAKAFKDSRPRLGSNVSASNANFSMATSYDGRSDNYYLFSINQNSTATYDLTIDFNTWNVQSGAVVSVEEVNSFHHGEVTRLVTVPQSKIITLSQPLQSAWLMTVPHDQNQPQVVLTPTDDARVRNSDAASSEVYADKNYGSLAIGYVGRTADSARFDYATYIKFGLGDYRADDVARAIFQITGKSTDINGGAPGPILFDVYALSNDAWNENTITWNNAPNLADLDPQVTGVATSAFPLGHLTFDSTQAEWGVDLTDFLRLHPDLFDDGALTLALVREQRFTGDTDPALSYVQLQMKESGIAPKLTLFLANHTSGDFDGDGDVDGADLVAWQTHFPTATGATRLDGDADGDGDVDGADFVAWQTHYPFAPSPASTTVPEPPTFPGVVIAVVVAYLPARRLVGGQPPPTTRL